MSTSRDHKVKNGTLRVQIPGTVQVTPPSPTVSKDISATESTRVPPGTRVGIPTRVSGYQYPGTGKPGKGT
eukprot:2738185-Rhodomonas_salina.1